MAPFGTDLWKTVILPFTKLTDNGSETLDAKSQPPSVQEPRDKNENAAHHGTEKEDVNLGAEEVLTHVSVNGSGNGPADGRDDTVKGKTSPVFESQTKQEGNIDVALPLNGPRNPIAAIASHTNPDGKGGGELKEANPPSPPQSATQPPPPPQPLSKSSISDAPSSPLKQPTPTVPPEPAKYRRHNVVLPSYEPELFPDNTVVPESPQKQFFQRVLHSATSWIFRRLNKPEEPRRITILERLVRTPHIIRRIAIIGVHGWFPGRFLQRVVGEPTGTSARFAEKMAMAVRSFFSERYNIMLDEEAITLIPLEGEGKVERRVAMLYRQLIESDQGWRKKLWDADMVFVAAHSQGTPVSAMLLARLVREGLIDTSRQKVSLLAMAGITHGPFPALKSSMIVKYFEADAARELFEFNDPNSEIAKKYNIAMRHILASGVRVVAVGSWYDQVVPLYSAVMHGFHHPNIYRALYIDGADYTPDFLSHLVVFGLTLRNAGLSDHDLVVHLSDILAGNLYGFGTQGHSAIYEEVNTYMVAVAWTMGGKPPWGIPAIPNAPWTSNMMVSRSLSAPLRLNPYYLPWIMARLVDDRNIQNHETLKTELDGLLKMFEMWEPNTRQLKEMRYRLEPLRSRL
ncbi:hypothetical protein SpCBS45565_g08414 [Spizellomyces sp. 'palustris']|nr:hypothetical protein SpCBS45565_g08414 [Spizellomyces sp. 'palustris']